MEVVIGYYFQQPNLHSNFGSISHIMQYLKSTLLVLSAVSDIRFFTQSSYIYIKIGTRNNPSWCGGCIIIFAISIFKFGFLFTVASSNVSLSRKMEYEEEEYHEWLQQWHFKRRSRAENKIHQWN